MVDSSTENKAFLYTPNEAEIISVSDLTPDEKLFSLRMKDGSDLDHLPGQFVQLSILGFTEAPISVASSPTRTGRFDLAIRSAGALTAEMHKKLPGDIVGIRGPFGSSFELSLLKGKDLLDYCRDGHLLPVPQVVSIVARVARALPRC